MVVESEWLVVRRVFPSWSVDLPVSFLEEGSHPDGYWTARDDHRMVSLTSFVVEDGAAPPADQLLATVPLEGTPVSDVPENLPGRAVEYDDEVNVHFGPVRVLQGVIAKGGRLLLMTATGGTPEWRLRTWLSIRHVPAGRPERAAPRTRNGRRRW